MGVFCYRLSGVLKAATPLHIGSGARTGVIKHCRSFIPGAALRGAVGTALLKVVCKIDEPMVEHEKCKYASDCVYARLFGEDGAAGESSKVFFRYSYPQHLKCGEPFRPAPKTLHRCSNPQCRKVFDIFVPPGECDVCREPVKPLTGFRCDVCGEFERMPVRVSRVTLTAVDRVKGSAAEFAGVGAEAAGTLHTVEVVAAGSRFSFEAVVHGDFGEAAELLESVVGRALCDEGVGGAKSRGLGKVDVEDLRLEGVDTEALEKRADAIDTSRFRVRLCSPLILDGKALDSSSLLEAARRAYSWAFRKGKPSLPEVTLKHWAVGGELFSGWSMKTGKRRKIESAVSAGSVFEFEGLGGSRELSLGLAALEYYAIGAYKPHGCGQVLVEKTHN